jgi:hypothetical protein
VGQPQPQDITQVHEHMRGASPVPHSTLGYSSSASHPHLWNGSPQLQKHPQQGGSSSGGREFLTSPLATSGGDQGGGGGAFGGCSRSAVVRARPGGRGLVRGFVDPTAVAGAVVYRMLDVN